MFHTLRAIHHEIGSPPLFYIGHLPPQQRFEPFQADAAFQHAFALQFGRRRHHHGRIDPAFAAGLDIVPATHADGIVTAVDTFAKTVTVAGQTYVARTTLDLIDVPQGSEVETQPASGR